MGLWHSPVRVFTLTFRTLPSCPGYTSTILPSLQFPLIAFWLSTITKSSSLMFRVSACHFFHKKYRSSCLFKRKRTFISLYSLAWGNFFLLCTCTCTQKSCTVGMLYAILRNHLNCQLSVKQISWPRALRSWCIKGANESMTRLNSSLSFDAPWSEWAWITPKEHILNQSVLA